MNKCTNCDYCVLIDEGYSNYTVEGTTAHCLLDKNPGFPVDIFYEEEDALNFAEGCESFSEGQPVSIDVDRDLLEDYDDSLEAYSDDPTIKNLLRDLNI